MQPLRGALTPFDGLLQKLPSATMRLAPFVMGLGVTWPADDFGTVDKWPADDFDYTSFGQEVEALQASSLVGHSC